MKTLFAVIALIAFVDAPARASCVDLARGISLATFPDPLPQFSPLAQLRKALRVDMVFLRKGPDGQLSLYTVRHFNRATGEIKVKKLDLDPLKNPLNGQRLQDGSSVYDLSFYNPRAKDEIFDLNKPEFSEMPIVEVGVYNSGFVSMLNLSRGTVFSSPYLSHAALDEKASAKHGVRLYEVDSEASANIVHEDESRARALFVVERSIPLGTTVQILARRLDRDNEYVKFATFTRADKADLPYYYIWSHRSAAEGETNAKMLDDLAGLGI